MTDSHRKGWLPTPLTRLSAAAHAGALGLVLARRELWPFAAGTVVANHVLLTACGLWPRSTWLGPNWVRLPAGAAARAAVALTIDDGPDPEVTPAVLELLSAHGAVATFFCIGERVQRHAALAREIVRRGHAIENHSQRHLRRFSLLGPRALRAEIARAQAVIGEICGRAPAFFRAPAGLRSPLLEPVLADLSLQLASWTRRGFDTLEGDPERVRVRLTAHLAAGDILLLHDGHAARTARGQPVILEVLPALIAAIRSAGLHPVRLDAAR